ncbi:MAG TPA: MmcQ/YjbR family DNA-binding protein [Gaiellaceae bacterium]|nr:MmcQ/YjbR family DNA-binding protein [Gaiellaceae bacterium]
MPVTADEVREVAASLPKSYEAVVRGSLTFRVGQIVYAAIVPGESLLGVGFPKELREAAIDAEPEKFSLPRESDLRFNWIHANLEAIDYAEMRDLVENAWAGCVPKYVAREYAESRGYL